ncbi:MAG: tetratricopeptide repeat protein [Oscillospiraceae bacterium]|nr:tetratricopeptide repeat protein [Oscillospiraceae bacterium]
MILDGRLVLTDRLQSQLGTLVSAVEIAGQNNLSSSHVVAETTLAGLLNRVYGWALVNANAIRQNCPGIDLIDEARSIAVQVTATRTAEKVRHTLEEVAKSGVVYKRLIVLLITNAQPTPAMLTCTVPNYSGDLEVWNIPHVFRDARELDAVKLDALTKFMAAELGPVRERVKELPHLELPPASALQATGFVGREPELAEIRSRFARGDKEVYLTGLGGMGKTELAARYGREHPGLTYFVRFDTSFRRTLANMALGIRPRLTEEELRLEEGILIKKVLTMLERSSPDDLLILDNADSETGALADLLKEADYGRIRELPLRLLLTTRSDAPRPIRVTRMPDDPLFEIFRNHGAELSDDEMRALIEAVNGHTLTIDLIARTLADNWVPVSAGEMLDAIAGSTLREEDFPEVGTDYNGDPEQLHIYQRLRSVFQVAKIPPTEQQLLRLATLLPDGGMDVRLFRKALPPELLKVFPGLGRRGWLSADHQVLTIHPVIRLVCRTEQPLTEGDCVEFLDKLWVQYDRTQYRSDHYGQMAELFTIAHDRLGSRHGRWLNRAGILLNEIDQDKKLHDLYRARLAGLEGVLPSNSTELARAYNYYGISLNALGRYSDALLYGQKALTIRQSELPEDDVELAYSYNNVGSVHDYLGDHQKALEFKLKALEILKGALPPEHPDLATSYNSVGGTYHEQGNYRKALEYKQLAFDIRKRVLPPEHPHLATSYDSVGGTYHEQGDYQKALEYALLALDIQKKVLPPEHPHLAISYDSVGSTYHAQGEYRKALEYEQLALDIRKKVLPPGHPDLAISYDSVGYTYHAQGDYQKALEYKLFALDIRKKALPPEHPHLATSYDSVGGTYHAQGNYQKALEYKQIALDILKKALPPEHPELASSYDSVGGTYYAQKRYQKALEYQLIALDICKKALPPEHPHLASSHNNVGTTYSALGSHRKALEYKLHALSIAEHALPPEHPRLALYCHNIAWTYHDLGDFVRAAPYMRRAADIIERTDLPKTHPDRVDYPKWADELEKKAAMQRRMFSQLPDGISFPFGKK